MSIAEAALYGDLVKHLRDVCAQQLAQLKGISIESERAALDDVIRAWFFTPQDDLYGLTPQRMIRNEELGIANTIPGDRLGDMFEDDCPVCAAMRAEAEAGMAEYDPEGSDERWRIEDERMKANQAARKAEAQALPFAGADDPDLAHDIQQERAWLDGDFQF